jgi:HrpA-like RNA helicase
MDLSSVILILNSSNLKNLFELDFITNPSEWGVVRALELLFILNAIDERTFLTFFGKCMTIFPLDVKMSRSIIESVKIGERNLVSWVISSFSIFSNNFFTLIKFFSIKKNRKNNIGDDFFVFSKLLFEFEKKKKKNKSKKWCYQKGIDEDFLENALSIKKQLLSICHNLENYIQKFADNQKKNFGFFTKFKICLISGFFINSARKIKDKEQFQIIVSGIIINIDPFSFIKSLSPSLIIFKEIFLTSKSYAQGILSTRLKWILFWGNKIFK